MLHMKASCRFSKARTCWEHRVETSRFLLVTQSMYVGRVGFTLLTVVTQSAVTWMRSLKKLSYEQHSCEPLQLAVVYIRV